MNLKIGDQRNGYVVTADRLNRGAMAMSYKVEKEGRTLFLKQYLSPKPSTVWFDGYVAYQQELKRRVESSPQLRSVCYEFVEFFVATAPPRHAEASKRYYQVFEWVTGGKDLAEIIKEFRANPSAHPWERRILWAKVIMGSIARLHEQKIAHIDLKPENLIMIPRDIPMGFQLKLIDMDFSVLIDRDAPWHGAQGYVGTPKWMSPEHFSPDTVPSTHSDVFTCGLILYDLLSVGNPYFDCSDDTYPERVRSHAASPPVFAGPMPSGNDEELRSMIHRCLSPNPANRPTASELHAAIILRPPPSRSSTAPTVSFAPGSRRTTAEATGIGSLSTGTVSAVRTVTAPTECPARLVLTHGCTRSEYNVSTDLNNRGVARFGSDCRYWDTERQLKLQRRDDGWYVIPNPGAPNETLLNGKAIVAARRLNSGDTLAVGREAKGIQKLSLTVSMESL